MSRIRDRFPEGRPLGIGLELQIETAAGLTNIDEIAEASDRAETLVFGPADMSASLGLPTVTAGLPMPGYPVSVTIAGAEARCTFLMPSGWPFC